MDRRSFVKLVQDLVVRNGGLVHPFALVVLLSCLTQPASGDEVTIGRVETYGLHKVSRELVLKTVGLKMGDAVPTDTKDIVRKLEAIPQVKQAAVTVIRVGRRAPQSGTTTLVYIGIAERNRLNPLLYRVIQASDINLSADIIDTNREFERARMKAMRRGNFRDDFSHGHSMLEDKGARAVQEKFIPLADQNFERLSRVVQSARNAKQRSIAAWVIGYASDKKRAALELVSAARDPDARVRNNAIRALSAILYYSQRHPEVMIKISAEPFVDMLNSLKWTDRNKSLMILQELTRDGDEAILAMLRERAIPSLTEMASWSYEGHALMPFLLLGRLAGMTDVETMGAWKRGEREQVISRVLKTKPAEELPESK